MTRRVALIGVVLSCVSFSGCGYALVGGGSFLPDYIETVGIPMFENGTAVFEVEQLVTQEVRQEFIGRGRYRVVAETDEVDAVLTGSIDNIDIAPASFSDAQQASRYVFTLTAGIQFTDIGSVSSFFGQRSNAVERIAQDFAETVVSSILEAF